MHGMYSAVTAIQKCDLLISLGARFDDRVTGKIHGLRASRQGDPRRHRPGRVQQSPLRGRGDPVQLSRQCFGPLTPRRRRRTTWTSGGRRSVPGRSSTRSSTTSPSPTDHFVPSTSSRRSAPRPAGTIVSAGVGQHQMWASQFWKFEEPGTWINSGGAGTMGFGVPAAIGAKVGRPDRTVWCIDGDGCFQMTAQELVTARSEGIPIKVAILNNAYLGMVRQWQEMFYDERYSEVLPFRGPARLRQVGRGHGLCRTARDEPQADARGHRRGQHHQRRSRVIDFRTDSSEKVFPMVAAGASNDDIQVHPSQRGGSK